jgi:hypothetical protein
VGEEQSEELKMLALESTLPLDDVIKSLPAEVREAVQRGQPASAASSSTLKSEPKDDVSLRFFVLHLPYPRNNIGQCLLACSMSF